MFPGVENGCIGSEWVNATKQKTQVLVDFISKKEIAKSKNAWEILMMGQVRQHNEIEKFGESSCF